MRKHYEISDLQKLPIMVKAGYGEFYFFHTKTQVEFCLKFERTRKHFDQSYVYVAFTFGASSPQYLLFGKYDFSLLTFEAKSATVNSIDKSAFTKFLSSFNFVLNHINSLTPFGPEIKITYNGTCCRCGHELTNEKSVAAGFGNECLKYLHQELRQIQGQIF